MASADWDRLKLEYLSGNLSLRELADKHGVAAGTILAAASRGHWVKERETLNTTAYSEAFGTRKAELIALISSQSDREREAAEAIRVKALEMMEAVQTPQDLRAVALSLESSQRIARISLNLPVIQAKPLDQRHDKSARDMSNSELIEELFSDPIIRCRLAADGLSPDSLTDGEIIDWLLSHREADRQGGSKSLIHREAVC